MQRTLTRFSSSSAVSVLAVSTIFNLRTHGFVNIARAPTIAAAVPRPCLQIRGCAHGVRGQEGAPRRGDGPLGGRLHHFKVPDGATYILYIYFGFNKPIKVMLRVSVTFSVRPRQVGSCPLVSMLYSILLPTSTIAISLYAVDPSKSG